MGDRAKKGQMFDQFARISKAVSSGRRIEILDVLSQGERTVESLARETGQSVANTSQHLKVLRAVRLVESRRDERYIYYRLADVMVSEFLRMMQKLASNRIAEVDEVVRDYLGGGADMAPVCRNALLEKLESGEVILLDVRPAEEYQAAHLPTAVSVPIAELPARLEKIPKDKTVVAYCRGPYCVFAVEAVEMLRKHGIEAHRLEDGPTDWQMAGLPLESGMSSAS